MAFLKNHPFPSNSLSSHFVREIFDNRNQNDRAGPFLPP